MDKGEELEERTKAISDVLKTNVSEEDRASFQFLLRELPQQKAALQKKKLGNLLAKYGHASSHFSAASSSVTQPEVINVGSPSPQPSTSASRASKSKSKPSDTPLSKPPPKKRAGRAVITLTDSEPSKGLPTPPTQKVKTAPLKVFPKGVPKKNITVPSPDRRSDQTWSPTLPKKTHTTPSRKRKATTPSAKSKKDELQSDSDGAVEVAARSKTTTTTSQKRKARTPSAKSKKDDLNSDSDGVVEVAARVRPTTGHKPDLNWCH